MSVNSHVALLLSDWIVSVPLPLPTTRMMGWLGNEYGFVRF